MQAETKNNKLLCELQQQSFVQIQTKTKKSCASSNNKLLFKLEQQIFKLKQEIFVQAQTKKTNSLCKS